MKSSVITFPGSNCDRDMDVALKKFGFNNKMVWHNDTELPKSDLIVLPGGFSYGDYLRCGSMASKSKIMQSVINFAKSGGLVMGICNGYKDSYEKFRPPSKWNKLISFLDNLKLVDRYKCKITCNYVVNKENVKDIVKIDNLCKEYNLEELRLNIAQDWSENKTLRKQADYLWGYSIEQIEYLKNNYSNNIKGKTPWTWSDCFWVKKGIYMTVEGNLKVCALNTDTKSLGNIFTHSPEEILNSNRMEEIRTGCNKDKPNSHCMNCSYKELSPLLEKLIT